MVRILGIEGADRRKAGRLYVSVVQGVLLFVSETWVVIPQLNKALVGFHHWVVLRMVEMGPKLQLDGTWVYTHWGGSGYVGIR